mmetsp:Transcript_7748/g.28968  ORF Transcript_7748/g.28968 Transcript_7748/m.28968 type:complete len:242 (+) Transcript_7748:3068-3793(+)
MSRILNTRGGVSSFFERPGTSAPRVGFETVSEPKRSDFLRLEIAPTWRREKKLASASGFSCRTVFEKSSEDCSEDCSEDSSQDRSQDGSQEPTPKVSPWCALASTSASENATRAFATSCSRASSRASRSCCCSAICDSRHATAASLPAACRSRLSSAFSIEAASAISASAFWYAALYLLCVFSNVLNFFSYDVLCASSCCDKRTETSAYHRALALVKRTTSASTNALPVPVEVGNSYAASV